MSFVLGYWVSWTIRSTGMENVEGGCCVDKFMGQMSLIAVGNHEWFCPNESS